MNATYRRLPALFASLLAVLFAGHAALAQAVNGRNVTVVNAPSGVFTLSPGRIWTETGSGGKSPGRWERDGKVWKWKTGGPATFQFIELNRDDWSVYLRDESRGVDLQLDLHRRQIFYTDADSPQRPLYQITGSSAVVNGRNVILANLETGRLVMTGAKTWIEQGNDGGSFNFVEDARDDWSVYLSDASRGVRLQIDLHRKLVLYADESAPDMRPLYSIVSASATGS